MAFLWPSPSSNSVRSDDQTSGVSFVSLIDDQSRRKVPASKVVALATVSAVLLLFLTFNAVIFYTAVFYPYFSPQARKHQQLLPLKAQVQLAKDWAELAIFAIAEAVFGAAILLMPSYCAASGKDGENHGDDLINDQEENNGNNNRQVVESSVDQKENQSAGDSSASAFYLNRLNLDFNYSFV
ncbi:hypothetical protein TYRP_022203 [Tyrophagus putrescentiae]|nr:hypothetical protein TYRP_022203 [Tyrophagus putrescentiae]